MYFTKRLNVKGLGPESVTFQCIYKNQYSIYHKLKYIFKTKICFNPCPLVLNEAVKQHTFERWKIAESTLIFLCLHLAVFENISFLKLLRTEDGVCGIK